MKEIKFTEVNGLCLTPCPYGKTYGIGDEITKVGSTACQDCPHCKSADLDGNTVLCGHDQCDDNPVNHPSHYNGYDVECIEMMRRIWGDEEVRIFCKLNALKYRMRMGHKDDINQDFAKEKWYVDKMKELEK